MSILRLIYPKYTQSPYVKADIKRHPTAAGCRNFTCACLSLYFRAIPEGDPDVVFAVNGHALDQAVPEAFVIFLDGFLFFKLLGKAQYLNPPGLPVLDDLNDLLILCFGFLIAFKEAVITLVVFLLVYGCPAVLGDEPVCKPFDLGKLL